MDPFGRLIHGVVLIFFMMLLLPVAIIVFIATAVVYVAVATLLGTPTGILGTVLGLTWFGGTLGLIFVICVLAYRRVPLIGRVLDLSYRAETLLWDWLPDAHPHGEPVGTPGSFDEPSPDASGSAEAGSGPNSAR